MELVKSFIVRRKIKFETMQKKIKQDKNFTIFLLT